MVAAAIGGSAVAGLAGSAMSASASEGAANTQAKAAKNAADLQQQNFQQIQQNLGPYMQGGQTGLNALLGMLGLPQTSGGYGSSPNLTADQLRQQLLPQFTTQTPGTGQYVQYGGGGDAGTGYTWDPTAGASSSVDEAGLNAAIQKQLAAQQGPGMQIPGQLQGLGSLLTTPFSFNASNLDQTPGYQFTLQQGMKALNNQNSSQGLGLSGAQQKGLLSYATGLADNTYNQQYQNALQSYTTNYGLASDMFNRLSGLAGLGQNAAAGVGNAGIQTASNMGNFLTSGANASAAGQIGAANAVNSGLGSISNNGLLYSLMNNNNAAASANGLIGNSAIGGSAVNGYGGTLGPWLSGS